MLERERMRGLKQCEDERAERACWYLSMLCFCEQFDERWYRAFVLAVLERSETPMTRHWQHVDLNSVPTTRRSTTHLSENSVA